MALSPEEHDLLSRMDERLGFIQDKMECVLKFKDAAAIDLERIKGQCHSHRNLPDRVTKLEKWASYRDGALALLLLLVGAGRLIDLFNLITRSS
jgi:hypothetical protein